jgi:hypothetical protein
MKRVFKFLGLTVAGIATLIIGLIVYPQVLFAHVMSGSSLQVYSDAPIDEQGGRAFIAGTEALLAKWPIPPQQTTYKIFVANTEWRRRLVLTYNQDAGGVVYYVVSGRNAFLSGADFRAGTLIAPSGAVMPPPRTLTYYGAHEVAHLLTGEAVGSVAYITLPLWIREGVADYVALGGAKDFRALAQAVGALKEPPSLDLMNRFGVYPKYRLLVAHMIEREGWSIEKLLHSGLSQDEAQRRFDGSLPP